MKNKLNKKKEKKLKYWVRLIARPNTIEFVCPAGPNYPTTLFD
jgi:hypothetical protein